MRVQDMIDPSQDPSGILAGFVADLTYDQLPEEQREFIKKDILDELGVMIAGTGHEDARRMMDVVREWAPAGSGKGRVVVYGDALPPVVSAFANGAIARVCDLGDAHNVGGHITEWVVPALLSALPLTAQIISGKDFMTAFAAGAEWGVREQSNYQLQEHIKDTPGECGGNRFATAAMAKLLKLSKDQIWSAMGFAYEVNPIGEQQKYNEGSSMYMLQHGYACSNAVKSVSLARRGLQGVRGIYMGFGGQLKIMKHACIGPDFLTEDLGRRWVWREDDTMKAYAGCKYNHATLYGVMRMMKDHAFAWQDIRSIHFTVSSGCRVTLEPHERKWNPDSQHEALFSNPYAVAYTAKYGDCSILAFQDDEVKKNMADPQFRALMNSLHYTVDPEAVPHAFEGYIMRIALRDGRTIDHVESDVPGNVRNPMTWEQVEQKFWTCTTLSAIDLGRERYEKIIAACREMEAIGDMNELMRLLVP